MTLTVSRDRTLTLTERVAGGATRVDVEAGIVRSVKILGYESKNGRSYSRTALQDAIGLYEGIAVNIDHDGSRAHGRSVGDRAGWLESVKLAPDGLRGDLHLLLSDPRAAKVLEVAQRQPGLLGLSHDATGQVREDRATGKLIVERIEAVRSVDLVADPATTSGLFESTSGSTYERMRDALRSGGRLTASEEALFEAADAAPPVDDASPGNAAADFARTIRKASTESALTALEGRIGLVFDESDRRDLMGVVQSIRGILDEVEAAVSDPSTTIATAATQESYDELRASIRPGGRKRRAGPKKASGSYAALRAELFPHGRR